MYGSKESKWHKGTEAGGTGRYSGCSSAGRA